jgi:DNA repair protein RecO
MSRDRSFSTEAIVLKRTNVGESDRVVTLLTKDKGRLACVAKGVRKLTSSKRAYLEPGNHIKCLLISTHSMPLLTQATIINDCASIHFVMPKIRQLTQLLEIIDTLFVEDQSDEHLFQDVLNIRKLIVDEGPTSGHIKPLLDQLLIDLGYQNPSETKYPTLLEYVSAIADKPMKSWEYLKV